MRKRKGKWIAVSTSLIASLTLISQSGQAIMAQEVSDDNASGDNLEWTADAPEVSWQDIPSESDSEVTVEESAVEDVLLEESAEVASETDLVEEDPVEEVVEEESIVVEEDPEVESIGETEMTEVEELEADEVETVVEEEVFEAVSGDEHVDLPEETESVEETVVQEEVVEPMATTYAAPINTQQRSVTVSKHTIAPGDTLWSLAQRNNTTVDNLKKWNNLSSNTIVVNQSLYLSNPETSAQVNDAPRQAEVNHYTINYGDTLYAIAQRHNVTVSDLKKWNNLTSDIIYTNANLIISNPNSVTEEQPIEPEVPVVEEKEEAEVETPVVVKPTSPQNYVVKSGDTLYAIALRNGVTVNQLREWNNISGSLIHVNRVLVVSDPNAVVDEPEEEEIEVPEVPEVPEVDEDDEDDEVETENPVEEVDEEEQVEPEEPVDEVEQPVTENPTAPIYYIVKSGDTLYAIARQNNVTVDQLREWNNISGSLIHVNRSLIVSDPNAVVDEEENEEIEVPDNPEVPEEPEVPETPEEPEVETPSESGQTHTVKRGEYLYAIAQQYGVTVNQLREWNQLSSDLIFTNMELIVSNPNGQTTNPDKDLEKPTTPETPEKVDVDFTKVSQRAQAVVEWFQEREGQTTYSMVYRNGPSSYDCSSAVFSALISAGYLNEGHWLGTTETLYNYEGSLLTAISRDEVRAGDIFVSGIKGQSLGSGGHTGVALSNDQIIHSNYRDNGISTTAIEGYTSSGNTPTYWYRLNETFKTR